MQAGCGFDLWPSNVSLPDGPSFSFFVPGFVPGLPHVTLIELRLALISYQDYHMLLLTFAGTRYNYTVRESRRAELPLAPFLNHKGGRACHSQGRARLSPS